MRRLFTFGCSFTRYIWPTWADIVGQSFEYYENWGHCGAGNYIISSRVAECDIVNKLTKDDVVLVMFTSIPRIDFYKGVWKGYGNIYNAKLEPYESEWINNNWSLIQAFYTTWIAIKQTKNLLDNIGCEYKLFKGFDISVNGHEVKDFYRNRNENIFLDEYSTNINSYFGVEPDMRSWYEKHRFPQYVVTNNNQTYVDYHPTVRHHELWTQQFLLKYYTNKINVDSMDTALLHDKNIPLGYDYNFKDTSIVRNDGKFLLPR